MCEYSNLLVLAREVSGGSFEMKARLREVEEVLDVLKWAYSDSPLFRDINLKRIVAISNGPRYFKRLIRLGRSSRYDNDHDPQFFSVPTAELEVLSNMYWEVFNQNFLGHAYKMIDSMAGCICDLVNEESRAAYSAWLNANEANLFEHNKRNASVISDRCQKLMLELRGKGGKGLTRLEIETVRELVTSGLTWRRLTPNSRIHPNPTWNNPKEVFGK
jgi:hypothetical protein